MIAFGVAASLIYLGICILSSMSFSRFLFSLAYPLGIGEVLGEVLFYSTHHRYHSSFSASTQLMSIISGIFILPIIIFFGILAIIGPIAFYLTLIYAVYLAVSRLIITYRSTTSPQANTTQQSFTTSQSEIPVRYVPVATLQTNPTQQTQIKSE